MKRCLNCRKTYENNLSECPYCGYKPRSKAISKSKDKEITREFDAVSEPKTLKRNKTNKNIYAASSHSGSFYLQGGERLNKRYSVLGVMGFGAFGVAYECFDSFNQSNVVVKEYMPSYLVTRSQNGREVEPLSDEAEVTFSIGVDSFVDENNKLNDNDVHCVPRMIECFEQNNTSYVVTELVRGEALSSIIKRKGKLPYHATITIITSVLQGLRRLNKLGIIHGDICPDNIIVTSESETILLDYNLSDFNRNVYTQRDSGKLRVGYSALEMYYMNMEQGPWTDVYAAAATMYKMLTGITVPSAIKRKTSDSLTPLSKLGIPITQGAEKAMFKALKVDYEKRTKNPEDFLNGLMGDGFDNLSVEKEPRTRVASHTPSRPVPPRREHYSANRILNGILIFLILAIIAVVIWLFISGIFILPESVSNIFSRGKDPVTDTISNISKDDNVESISPEEEFPFYDNESVEEDSEEDTSSSIFDNLENIESFIDDGLSSIDKYFNNSSYSDDYDDSNESYYDDSQEYNNDYEDSEYFYSEQESYLSGKPEDSTETSSQQTSENPLDDILSNINSWFG